MSNVFNKLDLVFSVSGQICITVKTFCALFYLSEGQVLRLIKRKLLFAFKWKGTWYIFLPKKPITVLPSGEVSDQSDEEVELPNGRIMSLDWSEAIPELPENVSAAFSQNKFSFLSRQNTLYLITSHTQSSTLSPKIQTEMFPLSLGSFRATTEYKYGYYISYNPTKMSVFNPGSAGTLKSVQLPAAFFEMCRALDAAEQDRNGANPGLPPRRNLSTTISFDTGTIAVAATIPVQVSVASNGSISVVAQDYLGATYTVFDPSDGQLTSTNLITAFLELSNLLAAAEKAITPVENQPNNIQIAFDLEQSSATVSANMPFTTIAATNGDVTIHAIDYL